MKRFPILLAICALALSCGRQAPPATSAQVNRPSILLITIDALRADHVGWAGHVRPTTPFLDSLRARGTAFSNAHSVSSWTVPALASLMTGVYPPSHGVVHGTGLDEEGRPADQEVLPPGLPVVAELLGEAGYRRYGIVANLHGHEAFGFARGFDRYRCVNFKPADEVNRVLLEWQDEIAASKEPVFLWLHYFDPHWPYHTREPWSAEYLAGDPEQALQSVEELAASWPAMSHQVGASLRARIEAARALYDVEINYADAMIEAAYRGLPDLAEWLTIISADHGEEFFDHGELGHSMNLFGESVRIPLVVIPVAGRAAASESAPVSLLDIPVTVLHAAGAHTPVSWAGQSLLDESGRVRRNLDGERVLLSFLDRSENRPHRAALVGPRWKLIRGVQGGRAWLFDLERDPLERQDLAAMSPELVGQLRAELARREAALPEAPAEVPKVELEPEQLEALEALGYVEQ